MLSFSDFTDISIAFLSSPVFWSGMESSELLLLSLDTSVVLIVVFDILSLSIFIYFLIMYFKIIFTHLIRVY